MSSGEHRRSSRISEREAAMQTKNQSKGRDSSNSKSRKKAKIKPVQDLVLNEVENQVEKADTQSYYDHINSVTRLSRTPLPERGKLKILLGVLQRKDSNKFFAQPVNPNKVKYYDEVIKEPMDFGTIAKKLNEGRYDVLEEFERDVFLISRNATFFNAPETVYYGEGLAIEQLAKEAFHVLKTDPDNLEAKFLKKRSGPGRIAKGETEFSNSKSCTKRTNAETSKAPRDERRFEYYKLERDKASSSSLSKESVVSAVYSESKALYPNHENGIGYVGSIMRFAKDLGPTAQKVAIQMARRCNPGDFKIKNVASSSQFQDPNHIPALSFAETGTEIVPPLNFSESFAGSVGHMLGDTLNGELTSAGSTMSRYHASVGGIANAIEKRDTPDALHQTTVQNGSWCSSTGVGFQSDALNQKAGFQFRSFPVDYSQVGSSTFFTARKSNSIPNKLLFSNMKQAVVNQDKPVQTAEFAFPKPTMQELFPTRNVGASPYSEWCSSKAMQELSGRSAGSLYRGSAMSPIQAATDGEYQGFRSNLEQEGRILSGVKPPVKGPQYVQALTSGGGRTYGDILNLGGQLSNSFDLPMLGHGLTDGEVHMINRGSLEKGGQVWNQLNPTVLGNPHNQTHAIQEGASSRGDFQQRGQVYNPFNMQSRNLNFSSCDRMEKAFAEKKQ